MPFSLDRQDPIRPASSRWRGRALKTIPIPQGHPSYHLREGIFVSDAVEPPVIHTKPCRTVFLLNQNDRGCPWAARRLDYPPGPHFLQVITDFGLLVEWQSSRGLLTGAGISCRYPMVYFRSPANVARILRKYVLVLEKD